MFVHYRFNSRRRRPSTVDRLMWWSSYSKKEASAASSRVLLPPYWGVSGREFIICIDFKAIIEAISNDTPQLHTIPLPHYIYIIYAW